MQESEAALVDLQHRLLRWLDDMVAPIKPTEKVRESDIMFACEGYAADGNLVAIESFVVTTVRKKFGHHRQRVLVRPLICVLKCRARLIG